ncbi:MAG: universal stress protein UspA [Clostridiales Family XIII bacterium]|nr:universal stress protein UspA [Clostridiales Family XIII bacterium]
MRNVMVCVTQQKNCDRLIKYGREFIGEETGELTILHVAHSDYKFLGHSKEGEALEYLYEKALEYGAGLTVVRSDDIIGTFVSHVRKNKVDYVIMGESRESAAHSNVIMQLESKLAGLANLIIVPA